MGLDQPQADWRIQLRPVGRPGTQDDRMDEEPILVDQATLDESRCHGRTTNLEIPSELGPQPRQLLANVVPPAPPQKSRHVAGGPAAPIMAAVAYESFAFPQHMMARYGTIRMLMNIIA
jgi:hypothetical protein